MATNLDDLVSVIVSVYNVEHVLNQTLDCIANQTYRNLEIILVDDGSTDSSGKICDAFAKTDSRCKVIHKPNGGQGSAKNKGQEIASGAFLFFPDSDDTFNLDMIRILHEVITKDSAYDLAMSAFKTVETWNTDTTPFLHVKEDFKTQEYNQNELIQGLFEKTDDRFIYGWNKLYRKELLENLWCADYPRHEDFDFNFRVFLRTKKAVFVDKELYHWVQRSGSKTHQPDTWDLNYCCRSEILYDNWAHLLPENTKYAPLLLDALYRTMVFWEEWSRKSGNFNEVKAICGDYRKKTLTAYIKAKEINPARKIASLTLLACPWFAHVVMILTHNAR